MDEQARERVIAADDHYITENLPHIEEAIRICDCGTGDLCVAVLLKALIDGTLTEVQRRSVAVSWGKQIEVENSRKNATAEFLQALELATQPQRDHLDDVHPPLIYDGPKKGTAH